MDEMTLTQKADENLFRELVNLLKVKCNLMGIKIKNCHAHELVAAFFGHKSKAAFSSSRNPWRGDQPLGSNSIIKDRVQDLENLPVYLGSHEYIEVEMKLICEYRLNFLLAV